MTYEKTEKTTWGGVENLQEFRVVERTKEEQFYHDLMTALDIIKFAKASTLTRGLIETHQEKVKLNDLDSLSVTSKDMFANSKNLVLYVQYVKNEERRLGLRSDLVGISFVLNKDRGRCEPNMEARANNLSNEWIRQPTTNVPSSDAIVLASKLLPDF